MIETLLRQRNPSASIPGDQYLAVGMNVYPYIAIYKKNGDTFTRLPNPATLPAGITYGVAWNGNTHLACSHANYPYVTVYKRSGDTFTKLADFTTNEGGLQAGRIAFNSSLGNGAAPASKMAYIFSGGPGFKTISVSGDTFSVDANSATTLAATPSLNTAIAYNVNSGSGNYLAIAKQGIFIYSTANPPVRITQSMTTSITVRCVATNKLDSLLVYGDGGLARLAGTSAGPTFSGYSPSSLSLGGTSRAMAWDWYDASYLAVDFGASPYLRVYKWNQAATFTVCTLSSNPPGSINSVAWNYGLNMYLACCGGTSPFVYIYKRDAPSGTSFTRLSDPAVLPEGQGNSVAFSEPI